MNDPVCSYDLREAIEVGQVMEDLGFVWLEEPIHEFNLNLYQELCDALTIPVMGNETLATDIGISSQWLIQGGTDQLRGNVRAGATHVLKMGINYIDTAPRYGLGRSERFVGRVVSRIERNSFVLSSFG